MITFIPDKKLTLKLWKFAKNFLGHVFWNSLRPHFCIKWFFSCGFIVCFGNSVLLEKRCSPTHNSYGNSRFILKKDMLCFCRHWLRVQKTNKRQILLQKQFLSFGRVELRQSLYLTIAIFECFPNLLFWSSFYKIFLKIFCLLMVEIWLTYFSFTQVIITLPITRCPVDINRGFEHLFL